jgi:hypothetical protein
MVAEGRFGGGCRDGAAKACARMWLRVTGRKQLFGLSCPRDRLWQYLGGWSRASVSIVIDVLWTVYNLQARTSQQRSSFGGPSRWPKRLPVSNEDRPRRDSRMIGWVGASDLVRAPQNSGLPLHSTVTGGLMGGLRDAPRAVSRLSAPSKTN